MTFDSESGERLRSAWRRFQEELPPEPGAVRPVILRSWERCRRMGIDVDNPAKRVLEGRELERALAGNSELIGVSRAIMERIYAPLSGSGSFITLSDNRGVVLFALWDTSESYPIPHIAPGYLAAESSSGTNAIGTCLVEKAPVETLAEEHYCRAFHGWFCSAAPIFDAGDRVTGVLNVTLPASSRHQHTGGMMASVAYAISEQMRLRAMLREQEAMLEILDEGVIMLDESARIRSMNRKARVMLRIGDSPAGRGLGEIIRSPDIMRALMAENGQFRDQEAMLRLEGGGTLYCMLSLSHVPSAHGRVVTLRPTRHVKESAARVTGAKAVYTFDHIIGDSPAMRETVELARLAARGSATMLILGESGTGKELFAQAVHNGGPRAEGPFVVVNCGALPRDLVQSELFGYDEGAFTGASRLGKPGKFELADNGTIFLDEIGEMPLEAQVSLLRLLQNGEVTRVGGKHSRQVSVRVIAATNRNLEEAVRQQEFREDLFYRLNVFTLSVPSLREREGDIELLCDCFLRKFARVLGRSIPRLSEGVRERLRAYPWPGNVRELENTLERMIHMAGDADIIDEPLLPSKILRSPERSGERRNVRGGLLSVQEKETLLRALRESRGNLRAAARLLGISRSGLYVKLRRFGIVADDFR
ncbi:MAG: sigma-54-dependent Fis family transcriptional regulator [Desulfovibrionaceae bacterium]|nr:MAG: sigma-54-dependent Fis family transcriptional regulator [Desulfovibrionaceae bacterium]